MEIATIVELILDEMINITALAITVLIMIGMKYIRERLTDHKAQLVEKLIEHAVLYVQQVMPEGAANEKLETAIDRVEYLLDQRGIEIDRAEILLTIEASIKHLKAYYREMW